ncbi:MAG: RidA family protein [Actinomycetota bacterium]
MKATPEERLIELGITLPQPPSAIAAYVPVVVHAGQIWVSGQVPFRDGGLPRVGLVGRDISVEDAVEEARFCALNALAQLKSAAGSLNEIERILKLTVFVASSAGFHAQPLVANGASELFQEIFGESGRHARSAVGVAELPLGAPVEVEVIAALRG